MKNRLRSIIDYLFYNFMVEVIEDELEMVIILNVNGEKFAETKMKHLPTPGMEIEVLQSVIHQTSTYRIDKVKLSHYGNVVWLEGQITAVTKYPPN